MKISVFRLAALSALSVSAMGTANAGLINFISLTETGGYGESAWTTLSLSTGGVNVAIRGHATNDTPTGDTQQYAYLDWGNAGLGVCKDLSGTTVDVKLPGSTGNRCDPSSDDNTNVGESLSFIFDKDVLISNMWFNSNHDDQIAAGDKVLIAGGLRDLKLGTPGGANGIGSYIVPAGYDFRVAYANQQFYMSGMDVSVYVEGGGNPGGDPIRVPEPASLALTGLALCGLAATRRRRS